MFFLVLTVVWLDLQLCTSFFRSMLVPLYGFNFDNDFSEANNLKSAWDPTFWFWLAKTMGGFLYWFALFSINLFWALVEGLCEVNADCVEGVLGAVIVLKLKLGLLIIRSWGVVISRFGVVQGRSQESFGGRSSVEYLCFSSIAPTGSKPFSKMLMLESFIWMFKK